MPWRAKGAIRYAVVMLGVLVVIGILGGVKFLQISTLMAMGKEQQKAGPPPESVGSAVAERQSWQRSLSAVGSVAGVKTVNVSNESPGRVRRIRFESGKLVKRGEVLVELDTSVERAQLAALKAQRDLARVTLRRSRALVAANVLARAELDNHEAELKKADADIAALEAQIERKIVRAPFGGRLGIRAVDLGQYVASGTRLTELDEVGAVFVDFTLPQGNLDELREGMPVRVSFRDGSARVVDGAISAVGPKLDDTTRSVPLRSSVPNHDDLLRPGMFVNVAVVLPKRESVVAVPATAIVHAPFGDSVFVIEDKPAAAPGMRKTPDGRPVKVVRQQFVRLGPARGDFVAIEQGLSASQEVVSAGAFKLRNGAPVVVDNSVQPKPRLDPRPENR